MNKGHHVTTGGAEGIDEAAMFGSAVEPKRLHVYLPWAKYNREKIPSGANIYVYSKKDHPLWDQSVDLYHPNPANLKQGARALHARNYGIVCHGKPVDGVIAVPTDLNSLCGTGQAIRIAEDLRIPLFNLRKKEDLEKLSELLGKM